ncbi:hypothetical protein KSP40_PGU013528 [Platanthera guangdongensis]|uniref:Uncharacterized protein n=1 Tax=Platanthera guangdongensis TaxID=2320717 RepID=A0ABR2MXR7_9ASPA
MSVKAQVRPSMRRFSPRSAGERCYRKRRFSMFWLKRVCRIDRRSPSLARLMKRLIQPAVTLCLSGNKRTTPGTEERAMTSFWSTSSPSQKPCAVSSSPKPSRRQAASDQIESWGIRKAW